MRKFIPILVLLLGSVLVAQHTIVVSKGRTDGGSGLGVIVQSGLVAQWKFDDGSGDVLTDSIGSNDGELGSAAGADANDPDWVAQGLDFVAANTDRVRIPFFQDVTADFTLMVVVEWNSAAGGATGRNVFSQEDGTGTGRTWLQVLGDTTDFAQSVIGGSGLAHTTNLGTGYHTLAVKHDSGTVTLYADGANPVSGARTAEAATGQHKFGISKIDVLPFETTISYGLMYDRALTDAEVLQNHNWFKEHIGRGITLP